MKKLWHIYTMEYYSAIKRNTFESVLMRWMNLLYRVKQVRKKKQIFSNACIWNLERWYQRIYLEVSNGEADIENRLMNMGRGEERLRCMERVTWKFTFSSVQFSRSVLSDFLQPHESHHARPPCPSPTPGVHPDSRPSSQWYYPAISCSVVPFSACPQSLPASGSFPVSQLFAWGGQSTGVSALASFLPKKSQGRSPSE